MKGKRTWNYAIYPLNLCRKLAMQLPNLNGKLFVSNTVGLEDYKGMHFC